MHDLSRTVSDNEIIGRIEDILPGRTYLVGGCIRDMLLGRVPMDLDLVTFNPVEDLARRIAERLKSRPFWMDEKRGVMRIVLKPKGVSIDISMPKGADIEEDLRSRDLTINAMAYDVSRRILIDPLSGSKDLSRGIIRLISEENLIDDPLRGLRAIRFSVTLDFAMDAGSCQMIKRNAPRIKNVSSERIMQEFVQALGSMHGSKFFRLLTWKMLVPVLFAPYFSSEHGPPQDLANALFLTVIPACQELDGIIYACDALMPGCSVLLDQETQAGVKRSVLLRLAGFLLGLENLENELRLNRGGKDPSYRDSPRDRAAAFCSSLHFSSRSVGMVRDLLGSHGRTEEMLLKGDPSPVDIHRFCEDAGEYVPEALLLSLSRVQTHEALPRQTAARIWEYYRTVYRAYKEDPLVSGSDVITLFGVASGPEVGRWLQAVEEARARGSIRTRSEAIEYLRRFFG